MGPVVELSYFGLTSEQTDAHGTCISKLRLKFDVPYAIKRGAGLHAYITLTETRIQVEPMYA